MFPIAPVQSRWSGRGLVIALCAASMMAGVVSARHRRCGGARVAVVAPPAHACPAATAPSTTILVELRDPDLDLAHYVGADLPGVLDARISTPDGCPAEDLGRWRVVEVPLDSRAAEAFAGRLATYPAIVSARVHP